MALIPRASGSDSLCEVWTRAICLIVGVAFVCAAVFKLSELIVNPRSPLGHDGAWKLASFVLAPVELTLGLALWVRPNSIAINVATLCSLVGVVCFHTFRLAVGDDRPCRCFGSWSPSSGLLAVNASLWALALAVYGPCRYALKGLSLHMVQRLPLVARPLIEIAAGVLRCRHARSPVIHGAVMLVVMVVLMCSVLSHWLSVRTTNATVMARTRSDDPANHFLDQLHHTLQPLLNRTDIFQDGYLLLIDSSCTRCEQLLDEFVVMSPDDVPSDFGRRIIILELGDMTSETPLPSGIRHIVIPEQVTVEVPYLPLFCVLDDGRIASSRHVTSLAEILRLSAPSGPADLQSSIRWLE